MPTKILQNHHPFLVRILGIDPGSHIAGFACIECRNRHSPSFNNIRIVSAGAIRLKKNLPHAQRIAELNQAVSSLIMELKPHCCVLEKSFCGVNVHSALKLGETRGALISAIYQANVPYYEVSPTHAKKAVTGSGRASKEQVCLALETLLGFKRGQLPYDVTDALAIALSQGLSPMALQDFT